jgi:hypothetical protein
MTPTTDHRAVTMRGFSLALRGKQRHMEHHEHNPGEPVFGEHAEDAPHNPGEPTFGDEPTPDDSRAGTSPDEGADDRRD